MSSLSTPHHADQRQPTILSSRAWAGAALLAFSALGSMAHAAADPVCEIDGPVRFGGMNWESNLVLSEVERFIVEKGYGCKTDIISVETLPALAALERGDLDVNSEIWLNSAYEPWIKAEKSGKVKRVGDVYMGGESWFIPRYTAERLPELKAAADLPKFKDEFIDPEEPSKGRFYGCPAGWGCEVVSGNLFHALNLDDTFTLFSPGTGATQKAALTSSYQRKENMVFYYWYPTPLVGSMDLVKLDLPEFDADKHACLTDPNCADPQPTSYPENPVFTALNVDFIERAPKMAEFFGRVEMPVELMNATMAHLEETEDEPEDVAIWFLNEHQDVWTKWLPEDTAERVKNAL